MSVSAWVSPFPKDLVIVGQVPTHLAKTSCHGLDKLVNILSFHPGLSGAPCYTEGKTPSPSATSLRLPPSTRGSQRLFSCRNTTSSFCAQLSSSSTKEPQPLGPLLPQDDPATATTTSAAPTPPSHRHLALQTVRFYSTLDLQSPRPWGQRR